MRSASTGLEFDIFQTNPSPRSSPRRLQKKSLRSTSPKNQSPNSSPKSGSVQNDLAFAMQNSSSKCNKKVVVEATDGFPENRRMGIQGNNEGGLVLRSVSAKGWAGQNTDLTKYIGCKVSYTNVKIEINVFSTYKFCFLFDLF